MNRNSYGSNRRLSGPATFQANHAAMKIVMYAMKRHDPMNRATRSDRLPKASESTAGFSERRGSSGWSRRGRRLAFAVPLSSRAMGHALVVVPLAPVLREHVVDDVVDRDGAEQATGLVDDGERDQVVRREVARDLLERGLRAERLELVVEDAGDERGRRLAQQALEVGDAQ